MTIRFSSNRSCHDYFTFKYSAAHVNYCCQQHHLWFLWIPTLYFLLWTKSDRFYPTLCRPLPRSCIEMVLHSLWCVFHCRLDSDYNRQVWWKAEHWTSPSTRFQSFVFNQKSCGCYKTLYHQVSSKYGYFKILQIVQITSL